MATLQNSNVQKTFFLVDFRPRTFINKAILHFKRAYQFEPYPPCLKADVMMHYGILLFIVFVFFTYNFCFVTGNCYETGIIGHHRHRQFPLAHHRYHCLGFRNCHFDMSHIQGCRVTHTVYMYNVVMYKSDYNCNAPFSIDFQVRDFCNS